MTCPLCGDDDHLSIETVDYAQIFDELEQQWSASFDAATRSKYAQARTTEIRRCRTCGLEYFHPALAADGEFYARLSVSTGYDQQRWEFGEVVSRLSPKDAVVDFGAGEGAFLKKARSVAQRTVGLDYNREGIRQMRSAGIDAYSLDFDQFARENPNSFDVACAFQVLEHLPDPVGLLTAMRDTVKPDGRIFISLPNRNRYFKQSPLEPLDCPPHHLTRWSTDQLPTLATQAGLQLESWSTEPLVPSQAVAWIAESMISKTPLLRRYKALPGHLIRTLATSRTGDYLRGVRKLRLQGDQDRHVVPGSGRKDCTDQSSSRHRTRPSASFYERRGIVGHTMLAELTRLGYSGPDTNLPDHRPDGLRDCDNFG